jgi:hypothetical protein
MKWILIAAPILAGLIAAIATVGIGGLLLPLRHTASRSARFGQAPEALWAVVTDFPNHPSWRPGLKSIERLPDQNGHPVWREVTSHGPMPIEIVESDPPRRFRGRIADPNLPFGGTWTWDFTPEAVGCRVRITEDGEIYNPIFRYIARVMGYTGTMESYLQALGKKMGQEVAVGP